MRADQHHSVKHTLLFSCLCLVIAASACFGTFFRRPASILPANSKAAIADTGKHVTKVRWRV